MSAPQAACRPLDAASPRPSALPARARAAFPEAGTDRGLARLRPAQLVSSGRGGAHRRSRADGAKGTAACEARSAEGCAASHRRRPARTNGRAHGRPGAELRRPGYKARSDRRPEDAEAEQRQACEHQAHGLADVGFRPLQRACKFGEEIGANADDDRKHHNLDARAHHIAEHALGEEAGPVPQREGHEEEPGEAGELEFENADEHLHGEDEEGDDDQRPGEQQHDDGHKIVEEAREPDHLACLVEQRPGRGEAGACQASGLEQVIGGEHAPTCGQACLRERAEDDVCQSGEAVEDEGECADIEDLPEEPADDIVLAAHCPEESGKCDVDADQRRGQEADIGAEQPEPAIDIGYKRLQKAVDDVEVVQRTAFLAVLEDVAGRGGGAKTAPRDGDRRREGEPPIADRIGPCGPSRG